MKKYIKNNIYSFFFREENRARGKPGFQRIYHNHIRKCAGTSINKTMIYSIGGNENAYEDLDRHRHHKLNLPLGSCVGWNTAAINRGSFFYAFSHEPLHRLTLDGSTFTFCFLRNPVQRVISHYNMLKDLIDEGSNHPALVQEKKFAFGDFDHFLDNIPREHLEAQLFNFSASYNVDEAIYCLCSRINYVGDIKDPAKKLLPFLRSHFGLNINYEHLRSSRSKFKPSSDQYAHLMSMLSEEVKFVKNAEKYFGLNLKNINQI